MIWLFYLENSDAWIFTFYMLEYIQWRFYMRAFILSKKFPLFFLRSCSVIVLFLLFTALSLIGKFDSCGGFTYLLYSRELIFSAVGVASIALSAFYCMIKNNWININQQKRFSTCILMILNLARWFRSLRQK